MLQIYQLEQQIQSRMQSQAVPGLALAIVKGQDILYTRGFGVTSVEDGGVPVTPQTLFLIGSVAKPLIGTAIMRLVEAGKLDLDRPIHDYIDWLRFIEAGAERQITLRMLLSHSSGLTSSVKNFGFQDPDGLEVYVRTELPTRKFFAPPGKQLYSYSNDGVMLAGYIASHTFGQSFAEMMQALVFDPLHMHRTTYDPTVAMTYPIAQEHEWLPDGTARVLHRYIKNTAQDPAGPYPMSTVLDLANFALMQLNHGKFRDIQLLTPESVKAMQTNQVSFHTLKDEGYGITFRTEAYKGYKLVWHNGISRATTSFFCMQPGEKIAVMMLYNGYLAGFEANKLIYTILDQLLQLPDQAPEIQMIEPDRSAWSSYVGTYLSINYGGLATILMEQEHLQLHLNGTIFPLEAHRKDLYVGLDTHNNTWVPVAFLPEEKGPTQYIVINGRSFKRFEQDAAFYPDPISWARYVGTYKGDGGTLLISLEGEQLHIRDVEGKGKANCIPLDTTRFACQMGVIEFLLNDDNTVIELLLANAWHYPYIP